mgnify:CR=1 FL=1
MNEKKNELQMSEAFLTSIFLAVSGGFQDAYTYFTRDGVFSNAQTGNVVLMSERFMNGEVKAGLHYLIPLTAFFLGVLLAERIQEKFRYARRLHWRQGILLVEIILLFLVGFIPGNLNVLATTLVSFSCALQVQTFRKVEGNAYASTMCIGNLRSGTAALSAYMRERKPRLLRQALCYFAIIFQACLLSLAFHLPALHRMDPDCGNPEDASVPSLQEEHICQRFHRFQPLQPSEGMDSGLLSQRLPE